MARERGARPVERAEEGVEDSSGGRRGRSHESDGPVSRRSFVRAAVAIGGAGALSGVIEAESGAESVADLPYPQGSPSNRPEEQHLWSPAGRTDDHGAPTAPAHQIVLMLDYTGYFPEDDRETMEAVCEQLEEAFSYDQEEGLLFTVGYSPAYFDRQWGTEPWDANIEEPRAISPHMDPEMDRQDVFVHLASDEASIVLAAEEALMGEVEEVNGVPIEADLDGLFEVDDRRSVFVGPGLPAENVDHPGIDEDAPLSMGFDSLFKDSIPEEERVTIDRGAWKGGTIAQVSKMDIDLDSWYDKSDRERAEEMWAADFTPEDLGDHGERLGGETGLERFHADRVERNAENRGIAGHGAKVARARDETFTPKLLRRDGDITGTDGTGGLNFVGLVSDIEDWFEVAEAMYDPDVDDLLESSETFAVGGCGGTVTTTESGSLSGADESEEYAYDTRQESPCGMTIRLDGDDGPDFDLYVTLDGRTPSPDDYDRRTWATGTTGEIELKDGAIDAGTSLGILVHSYVGEGEYTLELEERGEGGDDGDDGDGETGTCGDVTDGRTESGTLDGRNDEATFGYATRTEGPCSVTLDLSGEEGTDFDLYVTLDGRTPSPYDYDRSAWDIGSDQKITVEDVDEETELGILVHSYSGAGEFELDVREAGTGERGNGGDGGSGRDAHHHRSGIASNMEVLARGHFLIPPRSLRALPPAWP